MTAKMPSDTASPASHSFQLLETTINWNPFLGGRADPTSAGARGPEARLGGLGFLAFLLRGPERVASGSLLGRNGLGRVRDDVRGLPQPDLRTEQRVAPSLSEIVQELL